MKVTSLIHRVVFSAVISVLILDVSVIEVAMRPIDHCPKITPPVTDIKCIYAAARALTVSQTEHLLRMRIGRDSCMLP